MFKLFVVTRTDSGYSWSTVIWRKYFLANDIDSLKEELIKRYGDFSQYIYEEESHITVAEEEFEVIGNILTLN